MGRGATSGQAVTQGVPEIPCGCDGEEMEDQRGKMGVAGRKPIALVLPSLVRVILLSEGFRPPN